MNKTIPKITIGLTVAFIAGILIIGNIGLVSSEGEVPNWFKGVAGFWAEDKISTDEFVNGIEFLLSQGIIKVPSVQPEKVERELVDEQSEIGFGYDTLGIQRKIADLESELSNVSKRIADAGNEIDQLALVYNSAKSNVSNRMADLKEELDQAVLIYNSAKSNVSNRMTDLGNEIARLQENVSLRLREAGLEEKSSISIEQQYRESDYDFMMRTGVTSASQILAELEGAIDRLMEHEGIFYFNTSQKLADLEKEIAVTEETQEVAMRAFVKIGDIKGESTD